MPEEHSFTWRIRVRIAVWELHPPTVNVIRHPVSREVTSGRQHGDSNNAKQLAQSVSGIKGKRPWTCVLTHTKILNPFFETCTPGLWREAYVLV